MDAPKKHRLGWIGIGRMGYAMAERLAKAGCDITVYNRTREKAEPLAKYGAKIAARPSELAGCDIVFTMVATGADVKEVLVGTERRALGNRQAAARRGQHVDLARGVGGDPREPRRARREVPRRTGVRECQGDQGGQADVRRFGPAGRLRRRAALPRPHRARLELRRRGRARAHRQDLPQRLPRRGHPVDVRGHHPRAEGGHVAPCLPRLHEQQHHRLACSRATRRRRW